MVYDMDDFMGGIIGDYSWIIVGWSTNMVIFYGNILWEYLNHHRPRGYNGDLMVYTWLVVYLPLWNIWVRQLGWWHSQLNGKSYDSCSKPPTSYGSYGFSWFFHIFLYVYPGGKPRLHVSFAPQAPAHAQVSRPPPSWNSTWSLVVCRRLW